LNRKIRKFRRGAFLAPVSTPFLIF